MLHWDTNWDEANDIKFNNKIFSTIIFFTYMYQDVSFRRWAIGNRILDYVYMYLGFIKYSSFIENSNNLAHICCLRKGKMTRFIIKTLVN